MSEPNIIGTPLREDAAGVPRKRQKKQDAPLEKAVTKSIRDYLKTQPDVVPYKQHGSQYGDAGVPDFLVCVNGLFVGIEVKRPNTPSSKPTAAQVQELNRINKAGGVAFVARSRADVIAALVHIRAGDKNKVTKGY